MKAKQNFEIYLDNKGNMTSYYSGEPKAVTKLSFKVGDEVTDNLVADLLKTNPDFLQVEYSAGQFQLTDDEKVRFNLKSGKITRPPIVPPRKYSETKLVQIYNEGGQDALEKIAVEEFGLEIKPRTRYNKVLTMILNEQEKRRRGG